MFCFLCNTQNAAKVDGSSKKKITRDFESLRGVKNADPSPSIHRCFHVRSLSLDKGLKANGIHQEEKCKVQKNLVNIVLIM